MNTTKVVEKNSPESWENSRSYSALLGDVPASFSSTTRSLVLDVEKRGGKLSPASKFLALRLLKGKNLKAPFYFAAALLRERELSTKNTVTDNDLLALFKPDEIAALFAVIYLYKKAKKFCDPTEWGFIAPALMRSVDAASMVGAAIPNVGLAAGVFAGAMQHIAISTFLRYNIKHFTEYRRSIKSRSTLFDIDKQMEYYGCTSPQIASIFIQSVGFGVTYSTAYALAFSDGKLIDKTDPSSSPFKVVELWMNSILSTGQIPQVVHDSKFYPPDKASIDWFMQKLQKFSEGKDVTNHWLERGKEDISPELTPQLYGSAASSAPDIGVDKALEELPDELKDTINKDSLAKDEEDI